MGKKDYDGLGFVIGSHGKNIRDKDYQVKQLVSYMLARTQRIFKYNGLPENIPQREIEKLLQTYGYCIFFKDDNGVLHVDRCEFSGVQNEYYLPTQAIVSNPGSGIYKTFTIDKDCVIVKNDSYYLGLTPLFYKYAEMIATNDITMYNVDILTRIQALIMAGDSNARKEAKIYIESIEKGDLKWMNSNNFTDNIQTAPYATNADKCLTNLIEYEQYLKAGWLNEIGLNANYNMKREALNSNESQLNGDFLMPFVDDMRFNREEGYEKVNKILGANISIEKDSSWEDVENRESIESDLDEVKNDTEQIAEDNDLEEVVEEVKDERVDD